MAVKSLLAESNDKIVSFTRAVYPQRFVVVFDGSTRWTTIIRMCCVTDCCTLHVCIVTKSNSRAPRVFARNERERVYIFMLNLNSMANKNFFWKKKVWTPIVQANVVWERDYGVDKKFNMFLKFSFMDTKRTSVFVLFIQNEIVFLGCTVHCTYIRCLL